MTRWRGGAAALIALAACTQVESAPEGRAITVDTGPIEPVLLLTGELDALSSNDVVVPTVPGFRLKVEWLAEDGTEVKKGDKVVEFDNSELISNLADKEQAVLRAANDLAKQVAQNRVTLADKRFTLRQHRIALDKAKIDAAIPADTLARRTYQEYQLALVKMQSAFDQAESDLATSERAAAIDRRIKELALTKAERDYEGTLEALKTLTLRAPIDGMMVIASNPWEGRKYQVGDSVWPGLKLVRFPDLRIMQVEAALSDVDDGRVVPGLEVRAWLDAYPDVELSGKVISVSPVANETDGNQLRRAFDVVIALDPVADGGPAMRPGMSVRVAIPEKGAESAVRVPREAVRDIAGKPSVTLAVGQRIELELGVCDAHRCEVLSGLEAGAQLEVEP